MITQPTPSLRCQAHWQNTQSLRCKQILPKSLPAHPTQTLVQTDIAVKLPDDKNEDKNGQLLIE